MRNLSALTINEFGTKGAINKTKIQDKQTTKLLH